MIYKHLPPVGSPACYLPELKVELRGNSSPRFGSGILQVWNHRWAGGHFDSVVAEFEHVSAQASSHLVYAGETGKYAGRCSQLVRYGRKSWTEAFFNFGGVSIEFADAIWLGQDPHGFAKAARINAYLLHRFGLPPVWAQARAILRRRKGFCRHADGGQLGGGHTLCPTVDMELWHQFIGRVRAEHAHGHFRRHEWGIE